MSLVQSWNGGMFHLTSGGGQLLPEPTISLGPYLCCQQQQKRCSQIYVDPNIENIFPENVFIHRNVSADKRFVKVN
jgi:hypothetical protein